MRRFFRVPTARVWQSVAAALLISAPWLVVGFQQGQNWRVGITAVAGFYSAVLGFLLWDYFALTGESVTSRLLDDRSVITAEMLRILRSDEARILIGSDIQYLLGTSHARSLQSLRKSVEKPILRLVSQRDGGRSDRVLELARSGEKQSIMMDFGETVCVFTQSEALIIEAEDVSHAVSALHTRDPKLVHFLETVFLDPNGNERVLSRPCDVDRSQRAYASVVQEEYLVQAAAVAHSRIPILGDRSVLTLLARLAEESREICSVEAISLRNWHAGGLWHAVHDAFSGDGIASRRIVLVPKEELAPGGEFNEDLWQALLSLNEKLTADGVDFKYLPADMSMFVGDWRGECTGFSVFDRRVVVRTQSTDWDSDGVSAYVLREPQRVGQSYQAFVEMYENGGAHVPLLDSPAKVLAYHGFRQPN